MYREPIDSDTAKSILGENFCPEKQYYLLSERDRFVVASFNEDGTCETEQLLEQERDGDEFEEDADLPTAQQSKNSYTMSVGSIITFVMAVMCLAAIAGAVLMLKYGR